MIVERIIRAAHRSPEKYWRLDGRKLLNIDSETLLELPPTSNIFFAEYLGAATPSAILDWDILHRDQTAEVVILKVQNAELRATLRGLASRLPRLEAESFHATLKRLS